MRALPDRPWSDRGFVPMHRKHASSSGRRHGRRLRPGRLGISLRKGHLAMDRCHMLVAWRWRAGRRAGRVARSRRDGRGAHMGRAGRARSRRAAWRRIGHITWRQGTRHSRCRTWRASWRRIGRRHRRRPRAHLGRGICNGIWSGRSDDIHVCGCAVVHVRSLFRLKRVHREMLPAALVLKSAFAVHKALRI